MQFIDLEAQYKHLKQRIDKRIFNVLTHGKYIMGPEVKELEERLADYVGVKHAITCANGTDALTLSLMALEVKEGDAIFCPTFTFFATAEVVAFAGATPVFVDSDVSTFNMCPVSLEKQIKRTIDEGKVKLKAIIAVDLFGLPANYPEITKVAKKYGLKIIEDAAQGFGGEIKNQRAGSFGDIATTSFFPAKPLGCYGDGGAVFTNNDDYAELIKSYRIHGKGLDKYDNVRIGLNSRLDTIQAAVLLEKLVDFPNELIARNDIAKKYEEVFSCYFNTPAVPFLFKSSWAQYTLYDSDSDSIRAVFHSNSIPTMKYYPTCLHEQTAFKYLNYAENDFPTAKLLSNQVFSLPISGYMSNENIEKILSSCILFD